MKLGWNVSHKSCTRCGEEKSAASFGRRKDARDGLRSWCLVCSRENDRIRRLAEPEKFKDRVRRYAESHKEQTAQRSARWRAAHPNNASERRRIRRATNPTLFRDQEREYVNRRRALLAGAPVIELVRSSVVAERDGWICHICGEPVPDEQFPSPKSPSMDHVIPLSRGGEHSYANVRLAHFGCNAGKKNRAA